MLLVEADEIVPNLWQGSWPAPGNYVRASGFSMLILCAVERQNRREDYPDVEVVHAPNYDDGVHKLTPDLLKIAITAGRRAAEAVKAGRKVLTTCQAGLNRSGLVNGIALHLLYGWDGETCVQRIRKNRQERHFMWALSNQEFAAALRRLSDKAPAEPGWQQTPSGLLVPV